MNIYEEHIKKCNIDPSFIETLIRLYEISALADPNRLKTGVDIFRNLEYGYSINWLKDKINSNTKILDIGSSSTIWPIILYKQFNCNIYATDVDMLHLKNQQYYLNNINEINKLGSKFFIELQDATKMTYNDNTFDIVCAISALEHIPGTGDIKAFNEIQRVLKPNGMFIFTAPFSSKFVERETDYYHHSYEKRYDLKSINERFNSASRLKRKELLFINGKSTSETVEFWYNYKLYENLGMLSMYFSMGMFEVSEECKDNSNGIIVLYIKE